MIQIPLSNATGYPDFEIQIDLEGVVIRLRFVWAASTARWSILAPDPDCNRLVAAGGAANDPLSR